MKTLFPRWIAPLICACAVVLGAPAATPTLLYSTGFEASEGFTTSADLAGQNGWESEGSSASYWNGVLDGAFESYGQQAYIGFASPGTGLASVSLWKSGLPSAPANQPIVMFSTLMAIFDSSTEHYDDFRWTVYNSDTNRLFTLDFDNHALEINYVLDDGEGFVSTGVTFQPNTIYELIIVMDTERNRWSAWLDNTPLVSEKPMTTRSLPLAIGEVDAVWALRDVNNPGDNYMAFDEYTLIAYAYAAPPTLQNVSRLPDGSNLVRVTGEENRTYVLEASANLQAWTPIKTNTPPDGVFEHLDTAAIGQARRFYRARAD